MTHHELGDCGTFYTVVIFIIIMIIVAVQDYLDRKNRKNNHGNNNSNDLDKVFIDTRMGKMSLRTVMERKNECRKLGIPDYEFDKPFFEPIEYHTSNSDETLGAWIGAIGVMGTLAGGFIGLAPILFTSASIAGAGVALDKAERAISNTVRKNE